MIEVPCNLCGMNDYRVRFAAAATNSNQPDVAAFRCTTATYGSHPQIVQCRNCGHVYANPSWSADELIDTYDAVEDEVYLVEQPARERTFRHHLQAMERYTGPGQDRAMLDVGAYVGAFVKIAREAGWDAIGLEPSSWAVQEAERNGLPMIKGTLDSDRLAGRMFEALTLWDVIEHVADPSAELARAHELLSPGGVIAVHTMDVDSLAAKVMGSRWPWLLDMHVHYFSRRTLKEFLEKAGFELLWTGAQGRYLSLGYLVTRVSGLSRTLGRLFGRIVRRTGREHSLVRVNFGDLITAFARKPSD